MYGTCKGQFENTPCVNNIPAALPQFDLTSLCPSLARSPLACCDQSQFSALTNQIMQAKPLFGRCPACMYDLITYWCEYTCSPDQSLFVSVTDEYTDASGRMAVNETEFRVHTAYGNAFWNACSNVKLGSTGQPVVKVIMGANNFDDWCRFMGKPKPAGFSPYAITCAQNVTDPIYSLHNVEEIVPCSALNPTLRCSTSDCSP